MGYNAVTNLMKRFFKVTGLMVLKTLSCQMEVIIS